MENGIKKLAKEKGLDKLFRKENLIVLILAGILLFIISLPTKKESFLSDSKGSTLFETKEEVLEAETLQTKGEEGEYIEELETRLTKVLSSVSGVGKVQVMITLKTSEELVVEKENPVNRSQTTENDSKGGSRQVNSSVMEEQTVYSSTGSSSVPFVIKTYFPKIEGVLIVAEGAGNGTINRTVSEIVQALFGVEAHKVRVVKMETKTD